MTLWRAVGRWALAAVGHRRLRAGLTVVGIALLTSLVALAWSFHSGYRRAVEASIARMGYHVLVTGKGCPHEAATLMMQGGVIPMYIEQLVAERIVTDPAVADATAFLMQALAEAPGIFQIVLGIDDRFLGLRPGAELQRGDWFSGPRADEVIVGFNVAETRRLELDDRLPILGREMRVRGVLSKLGTQDDGTIFLPLATAQVLFEKRDRVSGVGVALLDPAQAPPFIERMYDLPGLQVVRMAQVLEALLDMVAGVGLLLASFVTVASAIALTGLLNITSLLAEQRLPELGVLHALGCRPRRLLLLLLTEIATLAALGVVLGLGLAATAGQGIGWMIRESLPRVPSYADLHLGAGTAIGTAALVLVLCLLTAVLPAWRCARAMPQTAMRGASRWP